jgi:hypothetical protein
MHHRHRMYASGSALLTPLVRSSAVFAVRTGIFAGVAEHVDGMQKIDLGEVSN